MVWFVNQKMERRLMALHFLIPVEHAGGQVCSLTEQGVIQTIRRWNPTLALFPGI
jgi:hypothetical protein